MKVAAVILVACVFLAVGLPEISAGADFFVPAHTLSGVGVSREGMSDMLLEERTRQLIDDQTFVIMREPKALAGAKRIVGSPSLQTLFRQAGQASGIPATTIEAIALLESWGDPKAESPAGPRGIMQISLATARTMGLKVVQQTRYRVTKQRVAIAPSKRGKPRYRTVTQRDPYTVIARDERLMPERAIPAAARYLSTLEQKFDGRDWAIFAYHCGPGCVAEMRDITRHAQGIPKDEITVPRMFFSASPVWNRELYAALKNQMERDWSPTYYFRVRRAEQLLALYRRDPKAYAALYEEYKGGPGVPRAPHRLAVWYRDEKAPPPCEGESPLNRPAYFGYTLRLANSGSECAAQASRAALGALEYVAFETRRLHEALKPRGEKFQPLPVTALTESARESRQSQRRVLSHASGQMFDVDATALPPGELECLRFVLDDLGWSGHLGFLEESRATFHAGPAPSAAEFFTSIDEEAREAAGAMKSTDDVEREEGPAPSQRSHVRKLE
jgi:hypothetical protein